MSEQYDVDVLNRLLAAEYESLVPRLAQSDPFVSMPTAGDRAMLERMAKNARAHERDLIELILRLRGAPVPRRFATRSGGVHYVGLSHLIPALIEDLRRLVATYESAGMTGAAEADTLIGRIGAEHRRHLSTLESMHGNLAPPPHGDGRVETNPPGSATASTKTEKPPSPKPKGAVTRADPAAARG